MNEENLEYSVDPNVAILYTLSLHRGNIISQQKFSIPVEVEYKTIGFT